ncbi:MAG: hypothetical protein ACO3QC_08815 [Phycisphaerales bacterium]
MNAPKVPEGTESHQPAPGRRGCLRTTAACLVALFSGLYLLNPSLGIFEFMPDNLPVVGNLDEVFFTVAFLSALGSLGIRVPVVHRR